MRVGESLRHLNFLPCLRRVTGLGPGPPEPFGRHGRAVDHTHGPPLGKSLSRLGHPPVTKAAGAEPGEVL